MISPDRRRIDTCEAAGRAWILRRSAPGTSTQGKGGDEGNAWGGTGTDSHRGCKGRGVGRARRATGVRQQLGPVGPFGRIVGPYSASVSVQPAGDAVALRTARRPRGSDSHWVVRDRHIVSAVIVWGVLGLRPGPYPGPLLADRRTALRCGVHHRRCGALLLAQWVQIRCGARAPHTFA